MDLSVLTVSAKSHPYKLAISYDPSDSVLQAIRWSYFSLVCIVFLLGCWNVVQYLMRGKKWHSFPLVLMYVSCQLTLIIEMVRLAYPDQPQIALEQVATFRGYMYL